MDKDYVEFFSEKGALVDALIKWNAASTKRAMEGESHLNKDYIKESQRLSADLICVLAKL